MYLTSLVTTGIGVELAAVQRKLPDCVVVGFQLYPARTSKAIRPRSSLRGGGGELGKLKT